MLTHTRATDGSTAAVGLVGRLRQLGQAWSEPAHSCGERISAHSRLSVPTPYVLPVLHVLPVLLAVIRGSATCVRASVGGNYPPHPPPDEKNAQGHPYRFYARTRSLRGGRRRARSRKAPLTSEKTPSGGVRGRTEAPPRPYSRQTYAYRTPREPPKGIWAAVLNATPCRRAGKPRI